MKYTFFLSIVFFLFCCSPKNYNGGISYLIKNEALDKNISPPRKYISYKNFLFEFVTKMNLTTDVINSNAKNEETILSHHFINVLPKNAGVVFQIDSFKIRCRIEAKTNLADKRSGITFTEPDEMMKKMYKKFKDLISKDTIINNVAYKTLDTTFTFNDSMVLTNNAFFIHKKNLNTVFNIQASEQEKSIFPYTLGGIVATYKNDIVAKYLITDFGELTATEILICEDIIKRINSYKDQ
jgi:hypothetical protein